MSGTINADCLLTSLSLFNLVRSYTDCFWLEKSVIIKFFTSIYNLRSLGERKPKKIQTKENQNLPQQNAKLHKPVQSKASQRFLVFLTFRR